MFLFWCLYWEFEQTLHITVFSITDFEQVNEWTVNIEQLHLKIFNTLF